MRAGTALGERAARRLAAAGRRALARDDVSLAAGLLGRALQRLGAVAPERADLVLDWCEALLAAGDVGPAADAIAELDRIANDASAGIAAGCARLRAWHTCFAGQLTVLTAPEALHATADRVGAAARELAALDDAAGEAKAHFVHAQALARLGKVGACEAALDRALAAARRAGDRRRANAVLAGAPLAALWGPSPVTRASGRCLDVVRVLRITQGAPAVEAVALSCQGVLEALRGRTEAARRMIASSRTMVEELGISHRLYEADVFAGRIDLLEGDAPAAERALRAGYDGLRDLGLGIDAARAAALLGRALLAQDRAAEAETLSHESEMLAGDDLQAAIAWRGVRAEALARRGDHATAIALAEAAVAIAAATDALLDHADARLALAAALRAGGRGAEADAEERRAFELWEAKGATVLAGRAQRPMPVERPAAAAPTARPGARSARRVRPNFASEHTQRMDLAVAARDVGAIRDLWRDDVVHVDHVHGVSYGAAESIARFRSLIEEASGTRVWHEPLATLGPTLALCRVRTAAAETTVRDAAAGPSETSYVIVVEADECERGVHIDIYPADKLGAAVARLYERHALTLSDGPERERAAVTARVVAFMVTQTPGVPPAFDELWAPTSITVDHRSVGYGTLTGEDSSKFLTSWRELAEGMQLHVDDVLALEPHGFVRKTTSSGVWREGGGAFERTVCMLSAFGADGRVTHHETFDADREADALARFDALTAGVPTMQPMRRRVRANDASALAARFEAIFTAGDTAAVAALWADALEVIDHANGAAYDRDGHLASIRRLQRARDPRMRFEALATLGSSLCLTRRRIASSGTGRGRFDVGESEYEVVVLFEVDERGTGRRVEIFAADHLGAAIARLYERSAEKMPEGPSREHAAVAARAAAYILTPGETADLGLIYAATYEDVDHRTVGYGSVSGDALGKLDQSLQALADGLRFRIDDVLALEPHGFVRRTTSSGLWREGGGAFERTVCTLTVFGPDGRVTHHETFDADREADALARFDALTAGVPPRTPVQRRVRSNAVTRASAEFEGIVAARDFAALETFFAEDAECIDHPTGATYGAAGMRTGTRRLMQSPDASLRCIPLATLGDSWGLVRREMAASGALGGRFDVGAIEIVDLSIWGTDERGRFRHAEIFAAERLGAAIVRLYERYAESLSDGAASRRARAVARSLAVFDGPTDFDRVANANAPSVEVVDQRILGTWSAHGREAWLTQWRGHLGLSAESGSRYDAVLAVEPTAILVHQTFFGVSRESGGDFENVLLVLHVFDGDGRIARTELFEPERTAEALARFDALTANAAPRPPVRRRVRPNAATATAARFEAAIAARDEAALADTLAETLTVVDHANGAEYGRDGVFTSFRRLLRMDDPTMHHEPLATLGESLALFRRRIGGRGGRLDVGAYERDEVCVYEVDADGRFRHVETFAAERLRAAIGRLYERYAESLPDGPSRTRASGTARALAAFDGVSAADRIASGLAPSFVCVDHRTLSTWSAQGREEWLRHWREQAELAAEFALRDDDVLALDPGTSAFRQTFAGISRASGGAFENVVIIVNAHDADGLITRTEVFEPDQEAEALVRFDALTAGGAPKPPVRRRVRPNAATRSCAAIEAAFARRDLSAVDALLGDPLETIEHPTATRYGREGQLESSRRMMRMPDLDFRIEPLATLGDGLCLARRIVSASGTAGGKFDVGAYEIESIVVNRVDAAGLLMSSEVFASDHLCQAIGRLYALYAESLPDGPERTRAAAVASSLAIWDGPFDADRGMSVLAPSFVCVDHRSLGTWSTEGRDEWAQHWRGQAELAAGFSRRDDDIFVLAPGALVTRRCFFGINRATGGPFENVVIGLDIFGADGLRTRCELFESDREAEALARFDALVGLPGEPTARAPSDSYFANAATRTLERFVRASAEHDWQALADLFAPSLRFDDRRPLLRTELPRAGFLEQHRVLFDVPHGRWITTTIATRGERLVLSRLLFQGDVEGGGGALEIDHLSVLEFGDDGRFGVIVLFEPADLDAAYAELDARYEAGEGAAYGRVASSGTYTRAYARRDWDAIAAMCTPTFAEHDHRAVGVLGTRHGPAAWAETERALVELAPDSIVRFNHVRSNARGAISQLTFCGADGGYEIPFLSVTALGAGGKLERNDLYDPEQLDVALARFAELSAATPKTERFDNASTRTLERSARVWAARDWEASIAGYAPDYTLDDRRPLMRLRASGDAFFAQLRMLFETPRSRWSFGPFATRGEWLALVRVHWEGDVDEGGGAAEVEYLEVFAVDGAGRGVASVLFDPAEEAAARAELDARWQAGELHPRVAAYQAAFVRGLASRDWDALAALHAPMLVAHDHRLVGWDVLRGPGAYVGALRAMVDLAPDALGRLEHARTSEHGFFAEVVWVGTRDGGAFESPFLWVVELDAAGQAQRLDFYDPHHFEAARARFEEIGRGTSDALLAAIAKPNAAAATLERWRAAFRRAFETDDWDEIRALCATGMIFEDRRRMALLAGDRELMIASARERARTGARPEGWTIGTAGDRVVVSRTLFAGGPSDGRFEIEYLSVVEVDAAGLFTAVLFFDLDDARAAQREAWARWAAIEPAAAENLALLEHFVDAFNAHDLGAFLATMADDVVVVDHRRTGMGRIEGAGAYGASIEALWSLAPGTTGELGWHWPAYDRHGVLTVIRRHGRLVDGGEYESEYLQLFVRARERFTHFEMFELEDLGTALARFEALRPDPLRIPPNAATRAYDRWYERAKAGDWDSVQALFDERFQFEDRRRLMRLTGDRDMGIASDRHSWETGFRPTRTLLGIAGDRLVLQRILWALREGGQVAEVEVLELSEVDADGRFIAGVLFDLDDRAAASAELFERWAASGDHGLPPAAFEGVRAWNAHDLARLRTLLPADFYLDDRRRTGVGRLDGIDAYLASLAAVWELSRDLRIETLYIIAVEPHGTLYVCRWFGANTEGGEFDAVYVCLALQRGDRPVGLEIFELDELDAAHARFAELRTGKRP